MSARLSPRGLLVGLAVSLGFAWANIAFANDSGPGPAPGQSSREYNVLLLRMGTVDQGSMTFSAPASEPPNDESTGDTTADPPATGNTPPLPPGSDNTTGNTPPSMNGLNNSGTTNTPIQSPNSGSTEPASHWTTARANGLVSGNSTDPSSSDYWTRARANGQVQPGDSTSPGGGGGGLGDGVATGTFTATFTTEQTTGTWYAVDLGNFSLWFASGDSAEGTITFAGYATPEVIVGRTAVGTGGILEALFNGSFFVGQAVSSTGGDATPPGTTQP
jgi:hypothetical protein